jgi:two-component system, LytTR family, sensor kinase
MNTSLLTGKKVQLLLHVLVWTILFIFPSYLLYIDSRQEVNFLYHNYIQTTIYAIIFYINYFLLIPYLFFRKKKALYFASAFILVVLMTLLMEIPNKYLMPERKMPPMQTLARQPFPQNRPGLGPPLADKMPKPFRGWPLYNFVLISFLVSGFSLGLKFSGKLMKNEKKHKEAEKEKINTELIMLKTQINPHFLFNSLNTIYSLALIKSELTPEAIMKLSDMMRYVLQDVEKEYVPLDLEIQYIRHYVELQKLRLSNNVDLQLKISGDPEELEIPPMILIPFVENAFKYGTSSHEKAVIIIEIRLDGKTLDFKVSNQIFPGREEKETFGIGINNTRQRLQLIYPDKHMLMLTNNGKVFIVNLNIQMN